MIFCSGRTLRAALICGTALVAAPTIAQEVFFDGVNAQAFVQGALDAGFSQSDIVVGCIADDAAPGGDGSSSLGGFVSVTIAGSSTTVFLGEPCALAGGDPPDDDDDDGDDPNDGQNDGRDDGQDNDGDDQGDGQDDDNDAGGDDAGADDDDVEAAGQQAAAQVLGVIFRSVPGGFDGDVLGAFGAPQDLREIPVDRRDPGQLPGGNANQCRQELADLKARLAAIIAEIDALEANGPDPDEIGDDDIEDDERFAALQALRNQLDQARAVEAQLAAARDAEQALRKDLFDKGRLTDRLTQDTAERLTQGFEGAAAEALRGRGQQNQDRLEQAVQDFAVDSAVNVGFAGVGAVIKGTANTIKKGANLLSNAPSGAVTSLLQAGGARKLDDIVFGASVLKNEGVKQLDEIAARAEKLLSGNATVLQRDVNVRLPLSFEQATAELGNLPAVEAFVKDKIANADAVIESAKNAQRQLNRLDGVANVSIGAALAGGAINFFGLDSAFTLIEERLFGGVKDGTIGQALNAFSADLRAQERAAEAARAALEGQVNQLEAELKRDAVAAQADAFGAAVLQAIDDRNKLAAEIAKKEQECAELEKQSSLVAPGGQNIVASAQLAPSWTRIETTRKLSSLDNAQKSFSTQISLQDLSSQIGGLEIDSRLNAWISPSVVFARDGSRQGQTGETLSIAGGVSWRFTDEITAGVVARYGFTDLSGAFGDKIEAKSFSVGGFVQARVFNDLTLTGAAAYTRSDVDAVFGPGVGGGAGDANINVDSLSAQLSLSRSFSIEEVTITPRVSASYVHIDQSGFTLSDGAVAPAVTLDQFSISAGPSISRRFELMQGDLTLTPSLSANAFWSSRSVDDDVLGAAGGGATDTFGFAIGAGLSMAHARTGFDLSAGFGVSGIERDRQSISASLRFKLPF